MDAISFNDHKQHNIFIDMFEDKETLSIIMELPWVHEETIEIMGTPMELQLRLGFEYQIIPLPIPVSIDKAHATQINGIVEISLPKQTIST